MLSMLIPMKPQELYPMGAPLVLWRGPLAARRGYVHSCKMFQIFKVFRPDINPKNQDIKKPNIAQKSDKNCTVARSTGRQ